MKSVMWRNVECCLLTMLSASASLPAAQPRVKSVEFVVGDLLQSEGGTSVPDDFPFRNPFGVDFDSRGTMFIVELVGGRIHELVPGMPPRVVSGDGSKSYRGDGGPLAEATYNGMHNLAITKDDQALIADTWNHCVRAIDLKTRTIRTLIGTGKPGVSGDGGPASQATFNDIMCVTLNPAETVLHITDLKNKRIRAVDLQTMIVTTVAGNGKGGIPTDGALAVESPLVDPRAAAEDHHGRLYILERGGHALRRVAADGTITTVAGTGKAGFQDGPARSAMINSPKHICVDGQDRVFIADEANGAIRCYDPATETVTTILGRGFGDPRIKVSQPHGVCIERGDLYVVDTGHNRLFRVRFQE